jgi:hypothetical protein
MIKNNTTIKTNNKEKNDLMKKYETELNRKVETTLDKAFGKYPNIFKKVGK